MCMCVYCVNVCHMCSGAWGGLKKALNTLELESLPDTSAGNKSKTWS